MGLDFAQYQDDSRRQWSGEGARPLTTTVWYPAAASARQSEWTVAIFDAGYNARAAPLAEQPERLPLVLLSHGTGGSAATLGWLAEHLASHGYLVAAVNHHGNTAAEPTPRLEAFLAWWDRPRDVTVLIDRLLADPRFGPRIDAARIGVAGFSLGGYTALATAGVRLNFAQWQRYCAQSPGRCELPPEIASRYTIDDVRRLLDGPSMRDVASRADADYRDPRVRAVLSIAPVLGPAFAADSVAGVRVPLRIVVGDQDDQAPIGLTAQPVAASAATATLRVLPGVAHYSFLARCTVQGRVLAASICADPPGIDRAAVHREVADDALRHFDRHLAAAGR